MAAVNSPQTPIADSIELEEIKAKSPTTTSRFFALYTYHANRPNPNIGPMGDKKPSVADFLQREATSNQDFTLSVIATDLIAEQETEVRDFIFKKLSRGTVYGGSGNVNRVDIGNETLSCYYYLLRQASRQEADIDQEGHPTYFYTSNNEYVVCLLTDNVNTLELFRPELDAYSEGLLAVLDNEITQTEKIQHYLMNWYRVAAEYVLRCTKRFKEDTAFIIHTALLDAKLEVVTSDQALKYDLTKFLQVCSLSDLLQHLSDTDSSHGTSGSSEPTLIDLDSSSESNLQTGDKTTSQPDFVKLVIEGNVHRFENAYKSSFCDEWSHLMLTGDPKNPEYLRQVIEDCKLRTIQDLNNLKRLVRQAESDHYALYRAYTFLRDCGNGAVLLRHIWKDENTVSSLDTQSVLHVLEEFISETNGFTQAQV